MQKQKITRFEELIAWQKARELTKNIYRVTSQQDFKKDFALRDQIRRASMSVMSNIAEGFDRAGRTEFHQFLVIAKASCAEVRSQLYVALDAGYITRDEFRELAIQCEETSRTTNGLRMAVQKQRDARGFRGRSQLSPQT